MYFSFKIITRITPFDYLSALFSLNSNVILRAFKVTRLRDYQICSTIIRFLMFYLHSDNRKSLYYLTLSQSASLSRLKFAQLGSF
jgi:hypothetical protein